MDVLVNDLRVGARGLLRSPGFTATVLLVLALGIGANSAIFSVVDAVLLRLLPYADPDRLVMVWDSNPERGIERAPVSYANFLDWAAQNSVFEDQAAYGHAAFNLTGGDRPERVWGLRASAGLFPALGVEPLIGRVVAASEDRPGADPVVMLSYGLWRRRFGGQREIVGRAVQLDGMSYTVLGVMPPRFEFPQFPQNIPVDLWLPLDPFASGRPRSSRNVLTVAKLRDGVDLPAARAEMAAIARRLEQEYPESNAGWSSVLVPLHEQVVGPLRLGLLLLLGAVTMVLLIACGNVANLMMARATSRRREIAVRAALGAGRVRIVRQLLTEGVLLAVLGGAAAVPLAYWALELLTALGPVGIPRLDEASLDVRTLAFTLAISIAAGVACGLFPALRARGYDVHEALKGAGSRPQPRLARVPVRSALVLVEVALACLLLVGAGLLIRTFVNLMAVEPGFDADNVLTMEVLLPELDYPGQPRVRGFVDELLERSGGLPGVRAAGVVNFLPLSGYSASRSFTIDDRPLPPGEPPRAEERAVSPGYFDAVGMKLIRGRLLTDRDVEDAPPVVVISESMARRYWPDEDPVGKRLTTSSLAPFLRSEWDDLSGSRQIVGVVSDVRYSALTSPADDVMYLPYRQDPWPWTFLVLRSAVDPLGLVAAVEVEVRDLDPNLALFNVRTMENVLASGVGRERAGMLLLGCFALLATVLAAAGIYGVVSYGVAQRTREIGIRRALGAGSAEVVALIVRQGMVPVLLGTAAGLAAAVAVSRVMAGVLFEVAPTDPLTFLVVAALLPAVALVASYLPARRSARVDPTVPLQSE